MKIEFLGTGAADWDINSPSADVYSFRRFSSALLDGVLLIDPGPCVFEYAKTFGRDISGVKYVLNTHRHGDHFNETTLSKLQSLGAEFFDPEAEKEITLGKYTVTAYTGNHSTCPTGVKHFMITDGEKRLYYALDGAWLLYREYKAIKEMGVDMIVMDATVGDKDGDFRIFEHNDLKMVEEMQKTLKPYVGRFVCSHFARTLHTDHKTLAARLAKTDITAAYDTLVLNI